MSSRQQFRSSYLVPERHIRFTDTTDIDQILNETGCSIIQASNGTFAFGRLMLGQTPLLQVSENLSERQEWYHGESQLREWSKQTQLFTKKVPAEKFGRVISFFRWAAAEYRSEAAVFIYYSPIDGGTWEFIPPPQRVSAGSVHWSDPGPTPQGWALLGSIHSHGSSPAYHSSTDDEDEVRWNGIHITLGYLTGSVMELSVSTSIIINGSRFLINLDDIIECIQPAEFPPEWKDQVRSFMNLYEEED